MAQKIDSEFGSLLRRLRKQGKYSIGGLAGLLGMNSGQLTAVERGVDVLTNEQVIKAASILRTDPKPLIAAKEKDVKAAFERQWPMVPKPKPKRISKAKAR
jgi:transcriptional regulator with XRE-family HTH domain